MSDFLLLYQKWALLREATVLSRDDSARLPSLSLSRLLVTALFCNRIPPKAELLFFAVKLSRRSRTRTPPRPRSRPPPLNRLGRFSSHLSLGYPNMRRRVHIDRPSEAGEREPTPYAEQ